jgi:RimJ/RimL family protein N-acetyltransferase
MPQQTRRRSASLIGRRVILHTPRPGDQAALERLRADPEIDHFMGVDGPAATLLWRTIYVGEQSGALLDLVVREPTDDQPIGLVSFWDRPIPHEGAELSIWLGKGHRDAGKGTEALRLALGYAFSELRLHKVYLRVLAYNERAVRAYQKVGFQIEGRLREEMYVNGRWHDLIYMGLLEREFAAAEVDVGVRAGAT